MVNSFSMYSSLYNATRKEEELEGKRDKKVLVDISN
jgi:hypothetical protein